MALKNCAGHFNFAVSRTHGNETATAANSLGIDVGVLLAHSGAHQAADKAATRSSRDRSNKSCGKPARGHDRPEPGDCHDAKAGEETRATSQNGSDTSACARSSRVHALGIIRDDADVRVRNSRGLQVADGPFRLVIGIVKARQSLGHTDLLKRSLVMGSGYWATT